MDVSEALIALALMKKLNKKKRKYDACHKIAVCFYFDTMYVVFIC